MAVNMRKTESNENLSGKLRVPTEKRDVLFSKARYILNKRHIKRPWFNLNPFLEKTDESADLDNWFPGESKYIQPLESLVLCESLHSDHPIDTKELSIDSFFPYLLSEEWNKGCSIRVLEGQLLDQLLVGLYRMEREQYAVRHTTHAFARNSRPRTGCYKLADKEASGTIHETLILEFAHFGRLTKDHPNPKTLNPFEYLEPEEHEITKMMEAVNETKTISDPPTVMAMINKPRNRIMSLSVEIPKSPDAKDDLPKWGRRGSIMSKHVAAISFIAAVSRQRPVAAPPMTSSYKRHQTSTVGRPPEMRRQTIAGLSGPLGQDIRRMSLQAPSLNKHHEFEKRREIDHTDDNSKMPFPRSNKFLNKVYSLEFDEDCKSENADTNDNEDEDENSLSDESEVFFGEEFYLSDKKGMKSGKVWSAERILQRKKKEYDARREEARQLKEERENKQKECRLPLKFPKVENTGGDCDIHYETIKMPDQVPSLEEFIQILIDDEYYDPRYRNKARQKSKRITDRYYQARGGHRSSILFSLANLPDEIRNFSTVRSTSRKTSTSSLKKRESMVMKGKGQQPRMPGLQESRRNISMESESKFSTTKVEDRAQEVHAVTDSEPCKDHYMKHTRRHSTAIHTKRVSITTPGRRQTIAAPVALTEVDEDGLNEDDSGRKLDPEEASTMFRKHSPCPDENESSDAETEESDADEEMSDEFDAKKLNLRYSVERLRKKRRSKTKKKPAFIEILAKYYNMQNALCAFTKDSADKETKKARTRAKGLGGLGGKMKHLAALQKKREATVLGKMKHFNFLDKKPRKKMNLDNVAVGDFTSTDLEQFYQQLKEMLDKFVIRREIVVSDLQIYHAPTSVTFTRISCFQLREKSHEH